MLESALMKRKEQGWVMESSDNLDEIVKMAHDGIQAKKTVSIAYLGNVVNGTSWGLILCIGWYCGYPLPQVDLWERLADEDLVPSVGSDQTSCHNPYGGGYYPTGMTYDECTRAAKCIADIIACLIFKNCPYTFLWLEYWLLQPTLSWRLTLRLSRLASWSFTCLLFWLFWQI